MYLVLMCARRRNDPRPGKAFRLVDSYVTVAAKADDAAAVTAAKFALLVSVGAT